MGDIFLAVNLAVEPYGYAVMEQKHLLMNVEHEANRKFTESFISNLELVFKTKNIPLINLKGIGVIKGPGSYTGIRMGVSYVKTLAMSIGCSVFGYTSMRAIALDVSLYETVFAVVVPSKKGRCYFQLFNRLNSGVHPVSKPIELTVDTFKNLLITFTSTLTICGQLEPEFVEICEELTYVSFYYRVIRSDVIVGNVQQLYEDKCESDYQTLFPYYFHSPEIGIIKK